MSAPAAACSGSAFDSAPGSGCYVVENAVPTYVPEDAVPLAFKRSSAVSFAAVVARIPCTATKCVDSWLPPHGTVGRTSRSPALPDLAH